jgi:3-methyladenine DNA glycosylase AlkD
MSLAAIKSEMVSCSDPVRAQHSQRFFKTGKGEYGEGDKFLGNMVPDLRKIAKKHYKDIDLLGVRKLLQGKYHEHRLIALFILVLKYEKGEKKEVYDFYLDNLKWVNNWDLVDSSAHKIVGDYLLDKPGIHRKFLYNYAKSDNLWTRRVAIIATMQFIKNDQLEDTIKISEILLNDEQDIIHKAVGWMLRELGKKDKDMLVEFLEKYGSSMPRTMLRYSIEKFDKDEREYFLNLGK